MSRTLCSMSEAPTPPIITITSNDGAGSSEQSDSSASFSTAVSSSVEAFVPRSEVVDLLAAPQSLRRSTHTPPHSRRWSVARPYSWDAGASHSSSRASARSDGRALRRMPTVGQLLLVRLCRQFFSSSLVGFHRAGLLMCPQVDDNEEGFLELRKREKMRLIQEELCGF